MFGIFTDETKDKIRVAVDQLLNKRRVTDEMRDAVMSMLENVLEPSKSRAMGDAPALPTPPVMFPTNPSYSGIADADGNWRIVDLGAILDRTAQFRVRIEDGSLIVDLTMCADLHHDHFREFDCGEAPVDEEGGEVNMATGQIAVELCRLMMLRGIPLPAAVIELLPPPPVPAGIQDFLMGMMQGAQEQSALEDLLDGPHGPVDGAGDDAGGDN